MSKVYESFSTIIDKMDYSGLIFALISLKCYFRKSIISD